MEEDLDALDCPFTWNIPQIPDRNVFLDKLRNKEEQTYFLMNGFCQSLLECFERTRGGEIETALRKVQECEKQLSEYEPVGMNKSVDKHLWERSVDAMWHVLLSTKAHLVFRAKDAEELDKLMVKIKPVISLDDSNKVALLGIKSRFLMEYGPFETTERAISYLRKAVELDPLVPLWHFYLGKCLARYRRANAFYDKPSEEEISELEKAYSGNETPDKGVMLLESYGEKIRAAGFNKSYLPNKAVIESKIKKLLNDILNCAGDEWFIYWRSAIVAMKLPGSLIKKREIKSLIDMAIESSDRNHNSAKTFLYNIQCKYYRHYEKDYQKALHFAEESAKEGQLHACVEVISLKYKINDKQDIMSVIDGFHNQDNIVKKDKDCFLIYKANYLMFVEDKVHEAIPLYKQIMKENCKNYNLLKCRPLFSEDLSASYNLYKKLRNRLNELIRSRTDENNKCLYKDYLDEIIQFEIKANEPTT